jgi:hypothetical protein
MLFFFSKENIEQIKELSNKVHNDMELGTALRLIFKNEKFVLETPNDQDLGNKVRKMVKNF